MTMFLNTLISLLCIVPGLLALGCDVTCPVDTQSKRCLGSDDYCSGSQASCDAEGYCRCHKSVLYDGCTCLPHVSGCQIKSSPSTYVGLPSTDGSPETPFYGCVSTTTNCEYEVHVIGNYESSNGRHGFGIPRVAGDTYVNVNVIGNSSKQLILVFTSYEPVNWRLSLPSGVIVNRILIGRRSKVFGNFVTEYAPLNSGYGPDDGGGGAAYNLVYLTNRFGPISSFSGSYRADRWNVNINRSQACDSVVSTHQKPPIVIRFKKEKYTVNESAESITVVVLTNGPTDRNITVRYSTVDGTAQAPLDYTAVNQTSIIPPNSTQFEITILIQYDREHEQSEAFRVHLSLPDEPTVCIPDTTVNIINSDSQFILAIVGGVFGGILVLSIIAIAVVSYLGVRYRKSRTLATRNGTAHALNGNITTGQAHPPPSTTGIHQPPSTTAFSLPPLPKPSMVTITQPQTSLSITQAPPPSYDIHETFATYNEKLSEAPPEYDTASQDSYS